MATAPQLLGVCGISQTEVDRIIAQNSVAEFDKLEGVPGYCLETTSWKDACRLVRIGTFEALGQLGRHPSHIVVYRQFKAKVSLWLGRTLSSLSAEYALCWRT